MEMINKIKEIEQYVCSNFEELDLDDPIEEGYFEEYEDISGACQDEITLFEGKFDIVLPADFKELYKYKNGSRFFSVLPSVIDKREMAFCLMSLQEIENSKKYFQNRDALLSEFSEHFTTQDIEKMKDSRIKPYLFNRKWFPFAQYCDSCYLMLDLDPDKEGEKGQIICYIHDPDEVVYVAPNITELVSEIFEEIIRA
jgi:hypothetical protein